MTIKRNELLTKLTEYICPALLGATVCFAVVYALYRPLALLYSVIFLVAEYALFSLFDRIKKIKIAGGLIYFFMLVVFGVISMALMGAGYQNGYGSIITWFYGEDGNYSYSPFYLNSVFLLGGFFVISILYYFTRVRYRSLGVMLCILFPFVIYAKRAEEIPEALVTIIITLYLAVMVHNRRIDPAQPREKAGRVVVNRSYIISMALFISLTGAVTMLINKPDYQSKLERNSNYFDYVPTNATGAGNGESVSNSSSKRYGGNSYTGDPLFYFQTDGDKDIYYLRRQAYDYFDGDVWQMDTDDLYGMPYYQSTPEYMTDDILAQMKKYKDSGADLNGADPETALAPRVNGSVTDDGFNPIYLPAPLNTIADESSGTERGYVKYSHGEIYRNMNKRENSQGIDEKFVFLEQSDALYRYAEQLDMDRSDLEQLIWDSDVYDANFLNDYYNSSRYISMDNDIVDSKVTDLANEITKGLHGDMAKAVALESYFENNGFVYDLDYVPDDESIEYFLFDSKTGVCSSYATAMTLMARAVGLPARYVEGYAAFEKTGDRYIIRDSYAHAFVEVYISGVGWLTFDPTVFDYRNIQQDSGFDTAAFVSILGRSLILIAVVFVVIFIVLLDRIVERFFRIRLHFKSPDKQTLALYANVLKLVNFSSQQNYSSYTPEMLSEYISQNRGVSLDKLFALFEKTCYGGYLPNKAEFDEAYDEYKKSYKFLRKQPKSKK